MKMRMKYSSYVFLMNIVVFLDFHVLGSKAPRLVTEKVINSHGKRAPAIAVQDSGMARIQTLAASSGRLGNERICQCIPRARQCSIVPDAGNTNVDYSGSDGDESSYDYVPRRDRNSGRGRTSSNGRAPVVGVMKRPTPRSTRWKYPVHLRNGTRIVNKPLAEDECDADQKYCCDSNGDLEDLPDVEPLPGPYPESPRMCGMQTLIPVQNQPVLAYGQAEFGEYPWLAIILNSSNSFIGAGALLDNFHVVTAAHKVIEFGRGRKLKVRLGEWNTRDQSEPYKMIEVEIENIITHPNFNSANMQNLHDDVAIIKLMHPVVMDSSRPHIHPICLPRQGQNFVGQKCWVAGFGKEDFSAGKYSSYLKEVDLTVLESNACQARLRRTRLGRFFMLNRKSFMCAGGETGKDACTGDGGAPLVCKGRDNRFHLAGLVAFGIGCGDGGVPGVYVNVPSYINWVQNKIN